MPYNIDTVALGDVKTLGINFKANFDAALECFNKALSIDNNYSLALLNKELTSEIISIFNE